jgi:hypothetical protein
MRWSFGQRFRYLWKHAGEVLLGFGLTLLGALIVLLIVPSREAAIVAVVALAALLMLNAWCLERAGDKLEIEQLRTQHHDFQGPGTVAQDMTSHQTKVTGDDLG